MSEIKCEMTITGALPREIMERLGEVAQRAAKEATDRELETIEQELRDGRTASPDLCQCSVCKARRAVQSLGPDATKEQRTAAAESLRAMLRDTLTAARREALAARERQQRDVDSPAEVEARETESIATQIDRIDKDLTEVARLQALSIEAQQALVRESEERTSKRIEELSARIGAIIARQESLATRVSDLSGRFEDHIRISRA